MKNKTKQNKIEQKRMKMQCTQQTEMWVLRMSSRSRSCAPVQSGKWTRTNINASTKNGKKSRLIINVAQRQSVHRFFVVGLSGVGRVEPTKRSKSIYFATDNDDDEDDANDVLRCVLLHQKWWVKSRDAIMIVRRFGWALIWIYDPIRPNIIQMWSKVSDCMAIGNQ